MRSDPETKAGPDLGRDGPSVAVIAAIAGLSASALAFEILLLRVFSIAQWHHFAHMVISLALLGYGASGTVLVFARRWLLARFGAAFPMLAAAFGTTVPASLWVAGLVPLNMPELPWDRAQLAYLAVVYVVLAVPFLFAGMAIGLAVSRAGEGVGRVYRSDLIGAGAGAAAIVAVLFAAPVEVCVKAVAILALASAVVAAMSASVRRTASVAVFAVAAIVIAALPDHLVKPQPSPFKGLARALTVPGAEIVAERSSPLGLLTVVRSPDVPWRHAPGMSLAADTEPPEQLAVFTDGGAMTAITRFTGDAAPLRYLDAQTAALPYHLLAEPRVLVLGAGGGADVLLARSHGARSVDAVEVNPQMVDLVRRDFAAFAGPVFEPPGVRVHVAEARSFVARSQEHFDLIQISLLDSFTTASAGLHSLSESTLYTIEAVDAYLDRLAPGGILALTRWLKAPPRDGIRLLATAVDALRQRGVENPGAVLALIRGWQTTTLLVAADPFTAEQIAAIRRFCAERGFDLAYVPGLDAADANRFNVLDRPYLHDAAAALLGSNDGRTAFLARYKFDVSPTTDDRPYFFLFLKGRGLIELLTGGQRAGLGLIEWGYPILLATLAQAIVVGGVLILLPLAAIRRARPVSTAPAAGAPLGRVVAYFLGLGLAFLFIEIAFIQKFQVILGHPLFAVSVVLASFLVFAGIGAGLAQRLSAGQPERRRILARAAVAGIAVLAVLYVAVLPAVSDGLAAMQTAARIAVAVVSVAPLALLMGMPFPLGLAATAAMAPRLVPWAWGINGCASVVSAVLAMVLAVHLGFTTVVIAAVAIYVVSAWAFPVARTASS